MHGVKDGPVDWKEKQGAWAKATTDRIQQTGHTIRALAASIGVGEGTLRNWLQCRTRVDPLLVSSLALQLGQEPRMVVTTLGILPLAAGSVAIDLAEMTRQASDLRTALVAAQSRAASGAIPHVYDAVLDSRAFSIEFRRSVEGIVPYEMHSADLWVLRALSDLGFKHPGFEAISDQLSRAGAAKQGTNALPRDLAEEVERAISDGAEPLRAYLCPVLNAIQLPELEPAPVGDAPSSILVVGTHLSTWATDVTSLIGRALGYGSLNTNLLTRIEYGHEIAQKAANAPYREAVLSNFLDDPMAFRHYVWGHSATEGLGAVRDYLVSNRRGPAACIYLRPTDRLHEYISHRPSLPIAVETLRRERDLMDVAVGESSRKTLTINVGFPQEIKPALPASPELRALFFHRSMEVARQILEWIGTTSNLHPSCPEPFRRYIEGVATGVPETVKFL